MHEALSPLHSRFHICTSLCLERFFLRHLSSSLLIPLKTQLMSRCLQTCPVLLTLLLPLCSRCLRHPAGAWSPSRPNSYLPGGARTPLFYPPSMVPRNGQMLVMDREHTHNKENSTLPRSSFFWVQGRLLGICLGAAVGPVDILPPHVFHGPGLPCSAEGRTSCTHRIWSRGASCTNHKNRIGKDNDFPVCEGRKGHLSPVCS